jgi:hypothetical protein
MLVAPLRNQISKRYPFSQHKSWYNLDTLLIAYLLFSSERYALKLNAICELAAKLDRRKVDKDVAVDMVGAAIRDALTSDFYGCNLVVNWDQLAGLFVGHFEVDSNEVLKLKRYGQ